MSLDPCVPPAAHENASTAPPGLRHLSHRIGSRHFHRLRHALPLDPAAPNPAESCGKHFADGQPGKLAARPTDGGPPLTTAKGKAAAAKLAAFGAASLMGAAVTAGALAASLSLGPPNLSRLFAAASLQPRTVPTTALAVPQGTSSGSSPAASAPVTAPAVGQVATQLPEPSSLALLGGFATLTLVASLAHRAGHKRARRPPKR